MDEHGDQATRRSASSRCMKDTAFLGCIMMFLLHPASSFSLRRGGYSSRLHRCSILHPSSHSTFVPFGRTSCISFGAPDGEIQMDPSDMKLREIQAELKGKGVSFDDCFDRESLTKRLLEARDGVLIGEEPSETVPSTETQHEVAPPAPSPPPEAPTSKPTSFDRDATLAELRSLRVKELRTECAQRNIRWANMIEKEELVQALLEAREKAGSFSPSGALAPGTVSDINDDQLSAELQAGCSNTPLLLDVYATWCGPCQMMAPQMAAAATELGDSARVAKIDSDKYPAWASRLRVGGLPTVIVFDGPTGQELQRVEGALMKDGLVDLVRSHM